MRFPAQIKSPASVCHKGDKQFDRLQRFLIVVHNEGSLELGQTINGTVEISLERDVVIRGLQIIFYAEVRYGDGHRTSQFAQYTDEVSEKWRSGSLISGGHHSIPFRLRSGDDLPSSFIGKGGGEIRGLVYFVEAILTEKCETEDIKHIKRHRLVLFGPPRIIPSTFADNVAVQKGAWFVRNLVHSDGFVAAAILLPKKVYFPGDSVFFNTEILNASRNLRCHIALVQSAKIAQDDGSFETKHHCLLRYSLGSLAVSESCKSWRGQSIWIPDPQLAPVHFQHVEGRRMVCLGYSLVLTIKHCPLRDPLRISTPLVIKPRSMSHCVKNRPSPSGAATL